MFKNVHILLSIILFIIICNIIATTDIDAKVAEEECNAPAIPSLSPHLNDIDEYQRNVDSPSSSPFIKQNDQTTEKNESETHSTTNSSTINTNSTSDRVTSFIDSIRDQFVSLFGIAAAPHFFSKHFERLPLHVHRNDSSYFSSLLGLNDLDLLIDTSYSVTDDNNFQDENSFNNYPIAPLNDQDLKIVKRIKSDVDNEYYTVYYPLKELSTINSETIREAFHHGFTVVFNRINYRWGPLARLCQLFTDLLFGYRCNINLYLTPFNSTGFEPHFDWMESFIIQLHGIKTWSIYDTVINLPFANQRFKPKKQDYLKTQPEHITLFPGDVLYIPSGVVHDATTDHKQVLKSKNQIKQLKQLKKKNKSLLKEPSLHITVGVEIDPIYTYSGLFHILLRQAHLNNETFHQITDSVIADYTCNSNSTIVKSDLRWIDLMQLSVHELSQRPMNYRLRKSLYGIHFLHLNYSTSIVQTFLKQINTQLHSLSVNFTNAINVTYLIHFTEFAQQLRNEHQKMSNQELKSSKLEGKQKAAKESIVLFQDEHISPLIETAINSTFLRQVKADSVCGKTYIEQLSSGIIDRFQQFLSMLFTDDTPTSSSSSEQALFANISNSTFGVSPLVHSSLEYVHEANVASHAQTHQTVKSHVRNHIIRQKHYIEQYSLEGIRKQQQQHQQQDQHAEPSVAQS